MHDFYVCIAKFEDSGKRFRQCRCTISSIPINNFVITSLRFCQYRYIFKNMRSFKNLPRGAKFLHKCPFKTAVITGGNAGIGFETALDLAARGAQVICLRRHRG